MPVHQPEPCSLSRFNPLSTLSNLHHFCSENNAYDNIKVAPNFRLLAIKCRKPFVVLRGPTPVVSHVKHAVDVVMHTDRHRLDAHANGGISYHNTKHLWLQLALNPGLGKVRCRILESCSPYLRHRNPT